MRRTTLLRCVIVAFGLSSTLTHAAGRPGEEAADFPPGVFTDGQQYRLADLRGKVVVLYMYEKDCPTCRAKTTQEFNPIVEQYKGKPVKFIAVGAGDTAMEVKQYVGQTQIKMPVYVDAYSLMERRYGQTISLQNIYQFRIIGADGKIAGFMPTGQFMDRAVAEAKWKYKDAGYHATLAQAVDHFEWGRYEAGMKALKPHRKSAKKDVAESAAALYDAMKAEGAAWKAEAEANAESNSVAAFDGYAKVKAVFEDDTELMNGVDAALTTLKADKAVTAELSARKMWAALAIQSAKPRPPTPAELAGGYRTIAKKYPQTPTGQAAENLAIELGAPPPAGPASL